MNTLVTLVILVSCFAGLNALTCHSCGYVSGVSSGSDCADTFTGNYSTSCSSSDDTCQKTVVKIDGSVTTLSRGCTTSGSCTESCGSIFSIESCVYCCTTDDCNGASAVTLSLATVAATVLGTVVALF
ncbi:uncharacterized protein LOC119725306 isoform X2 [Patiria miniata]|nr:uncharacterized protein LOC119725306 isoform X2 [Patiria miniata]XP_038052613.1 uncharacterized protein LOC119725306 isoform X2 [Patiria miniata]XP_038052614.1 uncharacterized protein LOC119725306 isoform X2 [Patiria miniata]